MTLPARASEPPRLVDEDSGAAVTFKLEAASERATFTSVDERSVGLDVLRAADVFLRVRDDGVEDFVRLDDAVSGHELRYVVGLDGVAGLRQVGSIVEFLDTEGAPRLRVNASVAIDADKREHALRVAVRGCNVDRDPRGPWGRAVVAPGSDTCELAVAWGESVRCPLLVDPAWTGTGTMSFARTKHAAGLLPSGRVLVAGGWFTNPGLTSEIWDPSTGVWAMTASMSGHHDGSWKMVRLPSGKLLLACSDVPAGERHDEQAGTWSPTGPLTQTRAPTIPVLLNGGRVLAASGFPSWLRFDSELYDPATRDNECISRHCVDGYCCDTACTGACSACSGAKKGSGANGACGPIASATDPDHECTACSACSGAGACAPVTAGTDPKNDCKDSGSPDCQLDGVCDGGGGCRSYAQSVGCVAMPCSSGAQCQTGFCSDGVCCDSACNGQCEACDVEPNLGACVPVNGPPLGNRTPCVTGEADCAGACDGVNRGA